MRHGVASIGIVATGSVSCSSGATGGYAVRAVERVRARARAWERVGSGATMKPRRRVLTALVWEVYRVHQATGRPLILNDHGKLMSGR